MHEIRATLPPEYADEAIRLATSVGITEVTTSEVFVRGPNAKRIFLSVETSTPQAQKFTDVLLKADFPAGEVTLTSREVRAIVGRMSFEEVTRPMTEPFPDVIQDLWQLSHVTLSYLGRAFAGAIILATGIIENNPIAILGAALFLPFLSQVLALAVGMWIGDRKLAIHGLKAVLVSIALAIVGGATVAAIEGGPIAFSQFKGPLSSLAISLVIGITAGLSNADDTGRRYLIGVAAAVQLAIFPVWLGAALVVGLPSHDILFQRLYSFLINLGTIAIASVIAYALARRNERSII